MYIRCTLLLFFTLLLSEASNIQNTGLALPWKENHKVLSFWWRVNPRTWSFFASSYKRVSVSVSSTVRSFISTFSLYLKRRVKNEDWPVNWVLYCVAHLSLHECSLMQCLHYHSWPYSNQSHNSSTLGHFTLHRDAWANLTNTTPVANFSFLDRKLCLLQCGCCGKSLILNIIHIYSFEHWLQLLRLCI